MARFRLKPPKIAEADVLDSVQQFLSLKGWEHLRTFPGRWIPYGEYYAARGKSFTPKPRTLHASGLPDLLAVRPSQLAGGGAALSEAIWIELKRPGERPTDDQVSEHERLRRAGFTVVWCDGFGPGPGIEQPFLQVYEELGLR